jgi:hypothetical protein
MKLLTTLIATGLLAVSGAAQADSFLFEGNLADANQVVRGTFTVSDDDTVVSLFTTSYDFGGFDPALYLWNASGDLIDRNDDFSFDVDLLDAVILTSLNAGDYYFSLVTNENTNLGTNLADGFLFDSAPTADWPDGSTYWNLTLDGASRAAVVPEPSEAALLALGLGIVGMRLRRKKQA